MFEFKKGDFVFFDNNDIINFFIRWGSKGQTGHVGVMVDENNIAEFVKTGFRIVPISSYLKNKKIKIIVGRFSEENRERFSRNEKQFDNFVESMRGKKYDYLQLFKIAIAQFFEHIKLKYNNKRYFCSEFGAEVLIVTNILPKSVIPSNMTPNDLFDLFKDKNFGTLHIV